MSVRKRNWTTSRGEPKEAWVCVYTDAAGDRVQETFRLQKDAKARHADIAVSLKHGTHVATSKSVTVAEAGRLWLERKASKNPPLERTTIARCREQLEQHIVPYLGKVKLAQLDPPKVGAFEDAIARKPGIGPTTARGIMGALGGILAFAHRRGLVGHNVVRELHGSEERQAESRHDIELEVGAGIPSPDEVKAILAAAQGRWRPLLLVAVFTGLRSSELRGLRWADVDFDKGELRVRQRADRYNAIGPPKSKAGRRTVPIPSPVLRDLKVWKLQCPNGPLDLVFPNTKGRVESHSNIVARGLIPTLIAAGVTTKVGLDPDGRPIMHAKYTGLHSLRHFFASWCINRQKDGGLELPAKMVQVRMGHAKITMTLDTYGHLFKTGDDHAHELATAAAKLIG